MKNARDILWSTGAVMDGHFVLNSDRHASTYVNKDAVYPHTLEISDLCGAIAQRCAHSHIDVVLAPALGGIILSQWTAFHLTRLTGLEVLALYAEKTKTGDDFEIKRGYENFLHNRRVLVAEDVLTTGGSVRKVVKAARVYQPWIVAVAALCNRGGVKAADLDVPEVFALLDLPLETWPEEECRLCKEGVPINTKVGKGKEFLARKQSA